MTLNSLPCQPCQKLYNIDLPIPTECYLLISDFCGTNPQSSACLTCTYITAQDFIESKIPGPPGETDQCYRELRDLYRSTCTTWIAGHPEAINVETNTVSFQSVQAFFEDWPIYIWIISGVLILLCCCCCIYICWRRSRRDRHADEFMKTHHDVLLDTHEFSWDLSHHRVDVKKNTESEQVVMASKTKRFHRKKNSHKRRKLGEEDAGDVRIEADEEWVTLDGVNDQKPRSPKVARIMERHRKKRAKLKRNRNFYQEIIRPSPKSSQASIISDSTIALLSGIPEANQKSFNATALLLDNKFPSIPSELAEPTSDAKETQFHRENSQQISDSTVDFLLEGSPGKPASPPGVTLSKNPSPISTNTIAFLTDDPSQPTKGANKKQVGEVIPPAYGAVAYATPGFNNPPTYGDVGAIANEDPNMLSKEQKRVSFMNFPEADFLHTSDQIQPDYLNVKLEQHEIIEPEEADSNFEVQMQPGGSIEPGFNSPTPYSQPRTSSNSRGPTSINIHLDGTERESEEETHLVTYYTPSSRHHELNYYLPHRSNDYEDTLIVSIHRNSHSRKTNSRSGTHSKAKKRSRSPTQNRSEHSRSLESQRKRRRTNSNSTSKDEPKNLNYIHPKRDKSAGGGEFRDDDRSEGGSVASIPMSVGGASIYSGEIGKLGDMHGSYSAKDFEIPRPGHGKKLRSRNRPSKSNESTPNPATSSKSSIQDHSSQRSVPKSASTVRSSAISRSRKNKKKSPPAQHVLYDTTISEQFSRDKDSPDKDRFHDFGNFQESAMYMNSPLSHPYLAESMLRGSHDEFIYDGGRKHKGRTPKSNHSSSHQELSYAKLTDRFLKEEKEHEAPVEPLSESEEFVHTPQNQNSKWNRMTSYASVLKCFSDPEDMIGDYGIDVPRKEDYDYSGSEYASQSLSDKGELPSHNTDHWLSRFTPIERMFYLENFEEFDSDVYQPPPPSAYNIQEEQRPISIPGSLQNVFPHEMDSNSVIVVGGSQTYLDDTDMVSDQRLENQKYRLRKNRSLEAGDDDSQERLNVMGAGNISMLFEDNTQQHDPLETSNDNSEPYGSMVGAGNVAGLFENDPQQHDDNSEEYRSMIGAADVATLFGRGDGMSDDSRDDDASAHGDSVDVMQRNDSVLSHPTALRSDRDFNLNLLGVNFEGLTSEFEFDITDVTSNASNTLRSRTGVSLTPTARQEYSHLYEYEPHILG